MFSSNHPHLVRGMRLVFVCLLVSGLSLVSFWRKANAQGELNTDVNSPVRAVALQSDGKILIGGDFTSVNGTTRNRIARLNNDGTLDTGFGNGLAGATDGVSALAVQSDGKILIGGNFTSVNGTTRNRIARLNSDGTLDTGFGNGLAGVNGFVSALAVQSDGKILIGGSFTSVNGTTRNSIARLNSDGTTDTGFGNGLSGADSSVNALAVQSDGKILIGGGFTSINGATRGRIARLNNDGTLDTGFGNVPPYPNSNVVALAVQSDGKVLIGGGFLIIINGTLRRYIARLNNDGTLDTGFGNGVGQLIGANSVVYTLAVQSDGKILIGGHFTSVNGATRARIARLNSDGTTDTTFGNGLSGADSFVVALAVQSGGEVLIGGLFTSVNGETHNRIARLLNNGALGAASAPTLTTTAQSNVTSISAVLGGNVTNDGGINLTERGIVWATTPTPTTAHNKAVNGNGTGAFSATVTGLPPATTVYVRAYAINSVGTSYGDQISFTTGANTPPTIAATTGLTRQPGVAASNATIATVNDVQSGAAGVSVTVTSANPSNGVRLSNLVNANGNITADLVAECGATNANFTLQASDGLLTATATLNVTVTTSVTNSASLNPASLPNAMLLSNYSQTLSVSGGGAGPFTYSITNGALPLGLALSSAGILSGTPQAAGLFNFTVSAVGSGGCPVTRAYTLTVANTLLVNEFCFSGRNGVDDWYVELYNNTDQDIDTMGLKLNWINVTGDQIGVINFTPYRTIKARGYYLIAGSAYSHSTVAVADETAVSQGSAGLLAGLLVCNAANDVLDAAGTTDLLTNGQPQFSEGTPVAALGLATAEYAWVRKPSANVGIPQDTNHNANDFVLVATTATALNGITPKLGAPAPQGMATPPIRNAQLPTALLNPAASSSSAPNFLRDATALNDAQGVYPLGSFYLRRGITNNTGSPVTKLRARVVDITDGSVTGQANIRALDAADITVIVNGQPVAVKGVTLDSPPKQPHGGGLNSSLTIRLSEAVPAGGKVYVQFRLGILRGGSYRFTANLEATN